ncbi:MAG: alginate lyase family protein [Bryobacteraceae bacterium]|nr:alginate lyase family protein [Bryobacteraceae bacterium]
MDGDPRKKYAEHAARHLRAWFVDGATRMNPQLEYAQAIHGRSKGRGTGIIDTIHLVEVARAAPLAAESGALRSEEFAPVRKWFADYLRWMTTSANGVEERDARNNHGTCFAMQVAAFARLTGQRDLIDDAARRFETGDGRGIRRAIEFLVPGIADKKRWPHPPDVMYSEHWPMRQQALLFGGLACGRQEYLDLWKTLPASSQVAEVVRNYFIRQPALWT